MTENLVDETSDVEDEGAEHESRDILAPLPEQDKKQKQ